MKKIIVILLTLIINLFLYSNAFASCNSEYWFLATDNYNWTCSCMSWYHFETSSLWYTSCVKDKTCRDLYWLWAIDNFNWTCSCSNWYHFETSTFWDKTCIKDKTCSDLYWYNSKDNYDWTCSCRSWYWFKDNTYWWWKKCVSMSELCQDKFWLSTTYNSLYDKCECITWYDLKLKSSISWNTYECTSCYSLYWLNSEYDSINKSCWCKDWYTLKDWKCEEKNNSVYYFLAEFNEDKNEVIVVSLYDNTKYLLELKYTSSLYRAENFVWKSIVINLWTDFTIDEYDKFILNNRDTTTDIVSDILSVEKVDSDYTLKTCEDVYWSNSMELLNWKCWCKTWYEWSSNNTCILKTVTPIITTSYTQTNQEFNLPTSTKQSVDKVFNSIKLKLLFLPSDTKTEYYNTLSSKIDSIISKQKNQTNINILKYLNSLIKNEVNSINLFSN